MTDTLLVIESLHIAADTFNGNDITPIDSINYWMWIAFAQFILIVVLLFDKINSGKASEKRKFKAESLEKDVDFDNILKSSFHARQLYDELKVKCHPDRFPTNPEQNALADSLFKEISKNKLNLKKLEELKEKAITELNINL
jgi:hypothetical protein